MQAKVPRDCEGREGIQAFAARPVSNLRRRAVTAPSPPSGEDCMRVGEWLSSWGQDVKFACRQLRRTPGFAGATVVTLALGIGGTSSVFSVTNGVLLRPLPFPFPERIVQLWELDRDRHRLQFSDPNFDDVRSQSHSFVGVAELDGAGPASVAGDVAPLRATIVSVTHDFFGVMGARVAIGRTFSADEERE